ncbi:MULTISPECIES: peptidoglycan DD-metalloendopeptidase family protein [unclassified Microbacterium]|uniref:peptidoglycan DD-metalloendopeptidase family protein n=1 Tax=unclassified Microbacterium TaxID=2609290 RepID=UPI000EA9E769|nr:MULTISPECIES: M23 family metallopeptidase [unclassified Microbacterium]MBT2485036.1 M23 family metallopeptidase [Microbacterium sp. ISL-108]RKN67883.1 M23 family metallopeptidase [Microbacterium sp. CGR2]
MNDQRVKGAASAAAAAADECGCAPTPVERAAMWQVPMSRRRALGLGALTAVTLAAFGVGAGDSVAHATTYPSWDDVQRAKNNQAAKGAEIGRIEGLIQSLSRRVTETQEAAAAASDAFYSAQQAFFAAITEAESLQARADEQAAIAESSAREAGRLAAKLYRNGGEDTALQLFFSGSSANADQLLSRLGTMDKYLEYNQSVYDKAVSARNTSQALTDQATVARGERDRLQKIAEQKMEAAQAAADAAQAALDEQSANLETMKAQLAALRDTTTKTVAAYQEGVAARAAEAKARREREAAEAAARARAGSGGGGGGGSGVGGWVRPHGGGRSSSYGPRTQTCGSKGCSSPFHYGADLANGCGAPIFAANSGTVDYAASNGNYGNYVRIQHGGGISTGYAHIKPGGIIVRRGQQVKSGQVIAYAGDTGRSFGCHLHFEVYVNGGYTNPVSFMEARGVYV